MSDRFTKQRRVQVENFGDSIELFDVEKNEWVNYLDFLTKEEYSGYADIKLSDIEDVTKSEPAEERVVFDIEPVDL